MDESGVREPVVLRDGGASRATRREDALITDVLTGFSYSDVLDIALVAVFIHAGLLGVRRTRSAFVILGMVAIGALYLLAVSIGLHLTSFLFQAVFTVILVALVVIFQEEIRGFFEDVAQWILNLRRAKRHRLPPVAPHVDILVSTLLDLARDHIGALIVIRGRDEISHHVHGGVDLHGELSEPLLKSLFDPHSIGHDGAVVIADDRVVKFSCHLPLSANLDALGSHGTRHAAALGLSERVDSLCLVSSEERGTVSAARFGKLTRLDGGAELKQAMSAFFEEIRPQARRSPWYGLLRRNLHLKLAALGLSAILWFFFVHESVLEYRSFSVALAHMGLPPGLALGSVDPPRARLVVSGSRRDFYFTGPESFRITLKLFDMAPGVNGVTITASDCDLPKGLTFINIVPRTVEVRVDRPGGEDEKYLAPGSSAKGG